MIPALIYGVVTKDLPTYAKLKRGRLWMARNAAPEGGALTGIANPWAAKGQKTDFGIIHEPEDGVSGRRGGNVQEHAAREPNSEIGSATIPDLLMEDNLASEKGKSSDFAALVRDANSRTLKIA